MACSGRRQKGILKSAVEEATKWVGGSDRIHRVRGILACYDFSAKRRARKAPRKRWWDGS